MKIREQDITIKIDLFGTGPSERIKFQDVPLISTVFRTISQASGMIQTVTAYNKNAFWLMDPLERMKYSHKADLNVLISNLYFVIWRPSNDIKILTKSMRIYCQFWGFIVNVLIHIEELQKWNTDSEFPHLNGASKKISLIRKIHHSKRIYNSFISADILFVIHLN